MEIKDLRKHIFSIQLDEYLKHDYYKQLLPYLQNKIILDVGCVDHDVFQAHDYRLWNHYFLTLIGKKVIGIDIETKSINIMKKLGFTVENMNAESITMINQFDVVFAGELIEHLANPGLFLQNAYKSLKKYGKIILSTPNTYSLNRLIRVLQERTNEPRQNPDHTLYLTPKTMTMLALKSGLQVTNIFYSFFPFSHEGLLVKLNKFSCSLIGNKAKETMIVIIDKAAAR